MNKWSALAAMVIGISVGVVGCEHEHEGHEEKVALSEVPAGVRETVMREAAGGQIVEIEKETEDGKTSYEAFVMVNGEKWEIETDAGGKLVEKKMLKK